MLLKDFIFKVIESYGIRHTFGIPGDFVLPLYAAQAESGVEGIICTHEPNAVFAADGYSRQFGLGVVLTTYGAGALNMINPVAMAYAEQSPVVIISGAPDQSEVFLDRAIHHKVRDFDTQMKIFKEICIDCVRVQNGETAGMQIIHLFRKCVIEQRPVYLEIPKNLFESEVGEFENFQLETGDSTRSDLESLQEVLHEINSLIQSRRKPVIISGVGVRRYKVGDLLQRWSEHYGIPVLTSVMGKASYPVDRSNYRGMYMGQLGDPETVKLVNESDCVIRIGVIPSDVNTGFWTDRVDKGKSIDIEARHVRVSNHTYFNVHMNELIEKLGENCAKPSLRQSLDQQPLVLSSKREGESILPGEIVDVVNSLDLDSYHVITDIGDSWFLGLELQANSFMAPGYYASMGFAVPAALGACLAQPEKRALVFVGDGAFQMTGNEIATIQRLGLKATLIVINNKSYKMLESFDQPRPYYDLFDWNYVGFAEALGCRGSRVHSPQDLHVKIRQAQEMSGVTLIEAIVHKDSHPKIVSKIRELRAMTTLSLEQKVQG